MIAIIIKALLLKNRITGLVIKFDTEASVVRATYRHCDRECEKIITFQEIEELFSDSNPTAPAGPLLPDQSAAGG